MFKTALDVFRQVIPRSRYLWRHHASLAAAVLPGPGRVGPMELLRRVTAPIPHLLLLLPLRFSLLQSPPRNRNRHRIVCTPGQVRSAWDAELCREGVTRKGLACGAPSRICIAKMWRI